jgi:methyl-accepting chemotaxis protein
MRIEDTKVSSRLTAGFGLVLSCLLIVLVLGISYLHQMNKRMEQIVHFNDEEIRLAQSMYLTVTERALALRNLLLLKVDPSVKTIIQRV